MKIYCGGVFSPNTSVSIALIETPKVREYGNANWKLIKIKKVPLPQPALQLNIGTLPIEMP